MNYPKISIITPSYNQGAYIEETIQSVLNQNYPNLEYIIIDGGSTDNSVDIIKKFADRISYWISEPDEGMYHALQKGFERSTGEIMGWINSDDMLHPKSLFTIAEILSLDGVNWIQGLPNVFDERGRTVNIADNGKWSQLRHAIDDVCIQQDCTYWTRGLWQRAGGHISTQYKLAGDFELWNRFFQFEKLYTLHCLTGGFRLRKVGQLSMQGDHYFVEVDMILKDTLNHDYIKSQIKRLQELNKLKKILSRTRLLNLHFLSSRIDKRIDMLHRYPPEIMFSRECQEFKFINK